MTGRNPWSEHINAVLFNRQGDVFTATTKSFNHRHEQLSFPSEDEAWDFLLQLGHSEYSDLERSLKDHTILQSNSFRSPRHLITAALVRGELNVFVTHRNPTQNLKKIEALYSQIKQNLNQIIASEKAEAQAIHQRYQTMNALEKKTAHAGQFGQGLKDAGTSFLTWTKDVIEVISPLFRSIRQVKAYLDTPYEGSVFEWLKKVEQTYRESEYKELVEALGFDPQKVKAEDFKQAWEITQIIWDDEQCQSLLVRFAKDYYRAQHPLEASEFAGGAAFEILLTIVLMFATAGAGVAVHMASKGRLIRQMKLLGERLKELAVLKREVDRYTPKTSMHSRSSGNMVEDLPVEDRRVVRSSPPPRVDNTLQENKSSALLTHSDSSKRNSSNRNLDGILVKGKIPTARQGFNAWFDNLSPDELSTLWEDNNYRPTIERRIRKSSDGGGNHEWFKVSKTPKLKELGVSMNEIHSMVTPTERLRWKVPLDADHPLAGQPGGHRIVDPVTGEVTAPGSGLYHSELDDVIENANTIDELYDGVHQLRERWRIPEDLLPPRK